MKRIAAVSFFFLFMVGIIHAQNKFSISAGGYLALPIGNFGDIAGVGFGSTIAGEYKFDDKLAGTATLGYLIWSKKEYMGSTWSFSAIPLLAGAKYYFVKSIYGYAQLGLHIFSSSVESEIPFYGKVKVDSDDTEFTFGVGAGCEINPLDVTAIYYAIKDLNYIGLMVAYKFPLK